MSSVFTGTVQSEKRRLDITVTVITFLSLIGILAVWLRFAQETALWAYTVLITGFLALLYSTTRGYKPVDDSGFRPRVTVVIPAKNEEEAIAPVIRTIFASDYPSSQMEVIVVDDGSTDNTWRNIQQLRSSSLFSNRLIALRHEKNYGKRVALASAIAQAHGEIIVCIDSDSFVAHDAIKLLVQPLEDPAVAAVCGHGEAANMEAGFLPKLQHYWYAEMFRLLKGMESRLGIVSCCSGMLSAYRRSAILPIINEWLKERTEHSSGIELGDQSGWNLSQGLTSKLIKSPGEDRILTAFAMSASHARVVYQSNAVVRTIVPTTFRQFFKQQLRWNRAWIHGSLLASKFMWKKSVSAALTFYLFQFLTYFTPVVVVLWMIVNPIEGAWIGTIGFLAGTLYISMLHGLNTWSYRKTSLASIPYRMLFVPLSLFMTTTVLLYAWLTPWKMGWVTRTGATMRASRPADVQLETVEA